jgi:hypothetical protein
MKTRKGWHVVWTDGTTWQGDCPLWAEGARKSIGDGVVKSVQPLRIMGGARWGCGHTH